MLEETIEANDYWVFFYNSSRFLETGNMSYALAGNAPFIVDKYKGEIHVTGTARLIESYMDEFEKVVLPKLKSNTPKKKLHHPPAGGWCNNEF